MYEKEMKIAIASAYAAGEFIRNSEINTEIKSENGKDIKLSTDMKSEEVILSYLIKSGIPVLSEERGAIGVIEDRYWIIDPLDGSANYVRELYELTCISIALWDNGSPALGVVYRWYTDEMFYGSKGIHACCNGIEIYPSSITTLSKAYIATGFPVKRNYSADSLEQFIKTIQRFKKVRMFGTAALSGIKVAEGGMDSYIEEEIMLWDVAASCAIANAAGAYTKLEILQDYKCNCYIFSNQELMEDYNAQII